MGSITNRSGLYQSMLTWSPVMDYLRMLALSSTSAPRTTCKNLPASYMPLPASRPHLPDVKLVKVGTPEYLPDYQQLSSWLRS
jgi:hypothetical protein